MTALEVFDETIEALARAKVMTILNNHISDAKWCCNPFDFNGAWWNQRYSTQDWIDVLTSLTARYKDQPYVIGNDLRNEIRWDALNFILPRWGNGSERSDWKIAAKKASDAI